VTVGSHLLQLTAVEGRQTRSWVPTIGSESPSVVCPGRGPALKHATGHQSVQHSKLLEHVERLRLMVISSSDKALVDQRRRTILVTLVTILVTLVGTRMT
jgi:hypothetical protein